MGRPETSAESEPRTARHKIASVSDLDEGDEVYTSKGDAMDERPRTVVERRKSAWTPGAEAAVLESHNGGADIIRDSHLGIEMHDVGIVTVEVDGE